MRRALVSFLLVAPLACGGGDDDTTSAGSSGSAAAGSAGAGAGAGGKAGSSSAGKAGSSTAGSSTAGSSTAGSSTAGSSTAGSSTAGSSTAGSGTAGSATAGSSTAGSGTAGSGTAGSGTAGSATAGSGTAGSGTAGSGTAGSGTAGSGTAGSTTAGKWLMGYFPGYQANDLPAADIPFASMSHVAIGAVLPKADGSLDTSFYLGAGQGIPFAKDLADRAHKAGKKAILMIGGAGAHDGFVGGASAPNRAKLVAALVKAAMDTGADGFDLDWEPLPAAELDGVIALATDLKAAMPNAELTIPVGVINANFEAVPAKMASVAAVVDQVNVMTYSMAGAYPGWQSWHHSPLAGHGPTTPTSITSSVDAYLAAGVPAAKLGIGAGFYGLCYTSPVTGPKQDLAGATASGDDNVLSLRAISTTYFDAAAQKWDATAKAPYFSYASPKGPLGCTYLSYVDEQAVGEQTAYVKQKGLGGMIVWTINEGHLPSKPAGQRDPVLAAMWAGLQ